MPTYVAFLRAVNLGARRRFPAADVRAATEAAGGSEVATYLNTGNVLLRSARRSTTAVAADLAAAYAADRGFEVPVVVLTPTELREVVAVAEDLVAAQGEPAQLSVTLYPEPPSGEAVRAAEALESTDALVVRGRAAYVLLRTDFHSSKVFGRREFTSLGEGTARNITVLRELVRRWC